MNSKVKKKYLRPLMHRIIIILFQVGTYITAHYQMYILCGYIIIQ